MTKWTTESAKTYVAKVQKGKQSIGLKYWSAVDFLTRQTATSTSTPVKENSDEQSI